MPSTISNSLPTDAAHARLSSKMHGSMLGANSVWASSQFSGCWHPILCNRAVQHRPTASPSSSSPLPQFGLDWDLPQTWSNLYREPGLRAARLQETGRAKQAKQASGDGGQSCFPGLLRQRQPAGAAPLCSNGYGGLGQEGGRAQGVLRHMPCIHVYYA